MNAFLSIISSTLKHYEFKGNTKFQTPFLVNQIALDLWCIENIPQKKIRLINSIDYLPNGQLFNFIRKLQIRGTYNMFTSAVVTLSKPNASKQGDGPSNGPSYSLSAWLKYHTISVSWYRVRHRLQPIIPSLDQSILILNLWVYRSIALDTHLSS